MLSRVSTQWQEFIKHSRASGVSYPEKDEQIISVTVKIMSVLSGKPRRQ